MMAKALDYLRAAYAQLQLYRVHLENPPLLVVCNMDRFEIYTNFTNTVEKCYAFALTGLTQAENLEILRKVFFDPEGLKPGQSPDSVTRQAAEQFGQRGALQRAAGHAFGCDGAAGGGAHARGHRLEQPRSRAAAERLIARRAAAVR